jgi:hypothetical protein
MTPGGTLRFTRAERRIAPPRTRSARGIASGLLSLANIE